MHPKIYLRVWGDLACFTRPEMKVERVSYPLITPSAARGLLEAILFTPQFRWRIERVAVKKPITFIGFQRNEVKSRHPEPLDINDERTQRHTLALRDVEYTIEASIQPVFVDRHQQRPPGKSAFPESSVPGRSLAMFQRRAEKGQCFIQPCFGCREFPAYFELTHCSAMDVAPEINADENFGLMLYDVFDLDRTSTAANGMAATPAITYFPARLRSGIVDIPAWETVKSQLGEHVR